MRKLVTTLVILSLLLMGCAESPVPQFVEPTAPAIPSLPMPEAEPHAIVLPNEPPEDMTWISPGKVHVGNFYPGARAEWDLLVHNGKEEASSFSITYREPNQITKDYVKAPTEAQNWVIITDSTPILMSRETKEVLIVLDMPEETTAPPKWEFWISVIETTQTGTIHTELCSRWLIVMRK